MAVFTVIDKEDISILLNNYSIGKLKSFEGILEGVENTNYKIITSKKTYILTIFEKRINESDLPFFINLQNYLSTKNIKCPNPIIDDKNNYINKIKDKSCLLVSFLSGTNQIKEIRNDHCYQVGKLIATIHNETRDFELKRNNTLSITNLQKILDKCKNTKNSLYIELINSIQKELSFLNKNWPSNIPKGIIHADVFIDNIFFTNDKLSGIIDFYFSCYEFYAYELSICINAWCFNKRGFFDKSKFLSIMKGYEEIRKLTKLEINSLPILLKAATIRILITRLHDLLYHTPETYVTPKDPMEYLEILKFHNSNSLIDIYES